jgi:hypothetical protein
MRYLSLLVATLVVAVAVFAAMQTSTERSAAADGDPVIAAAGDIGAPGGRQAATAALLGGVDRVLMLGDAAYPGGTLAQLAEHYASTWGEHKLKTRPAPGNHDWGATNLSGYRSYFPDAYSSRTWYSFDVGAWHVVSLDSNCGKVEGCNGGSPQHTWLKKDLAAADNRCILAFWHHPRFTISARGGNRAVTPFWKLLQANGADVILTGHDHNYQRWARLGADGSPAANGIRQFIVGTGGTDKLNGFSTSSPHVEAKSKDTWGVLKLTLSASSYSWAFVPIAGQSYRDSGSTAC